MGETLLGKPYGLTHEDMIKAHHLFTATTKKTPYQLDLEVKDRKPDIVPKVGDKVKIKSREWYEKWRNEEGNIVGIGTHSFLAEMSKFCGKVFNVEREIYSWFTLKDARFGWIMSMFEEVYPQESSKEEKCAKGLYSSSNSASALAKQLTGTSAIPAFNSVQGIEIATDWSKLVSDTAARITLPQQNLFCSPGFYCQSLLEKEEPELQTIKKHRFIKLENL
ncbi:MAG: hypothetical protein IJA95_06790 [Bacteroidaceae bacterium]|nr:hypothetical protein [Bacteroidaceae bacterium]